MDAQSTTAASLPQPWRRNFEPPFSNCLCRCVRVQFSLQRAAEATGPTCLWKGDSFMHIAAPILLPRANCLHCRSHAVSLK